MSIHVPSQLCMPNILETTFGTMGIKRFYFLKSRQNSVIICKASTFVQISMAPLEEDFHWLCFDRAVRVLTTEPPMS